MSSTHTTNTQYIPIQRKRIGICIGMYWDFNTCQYAHNNFTNTHANTHAITSTPRSLITRLKVFQRWKIFYTNPKSFTRLGGQLQEGCQEFEVLAQTWWCRRRCRPIARAHLRLEFPAPQPRLEPARTGGPPHNGAFGRPSAGSGLSHPNSQPSESATRVVSRVGHYIILLLWMTMMLMMMMLAINRTTT